MKSKLNLVSFIQGPLEVQYEVQTVDHEKKKENVQSRKNFDNFAILFSYREFHGLFDKYLVNF